MTKVVFVCNAAQEDVLVILSNMITSHYKLEQLIQKRAHEIWLASGKEEGKAGQHWLQAEKEVLKEVAKGKIEIDLKNG